MKRKTVEKVLQISVSNIWVFIRSNKKRSCAQKSKVKSSKPLLHLKNGKNFLHVRARTACHGRYLGSEFI